MAQDKNGLVDKRIIEQTECWLDKVVIGHNICPFARKERDAGRIRYVVEHADTMETVLHRLVQECDYLEQNPEIETTLFILSQSAQGFDEYLDFLAIANQLLVDQDFEGVFQLASFHPDYCFEGAEPDDPANYTNRSPWPMLHIIREASLELALANYPNPELIPQRNIEYCRDLGLEVMKAMLDECKNTH